MAWTRCVTMQAAVTKHVVDTLLDVGGDFDGTITSPVDYNMSVFLLNAHGVFRDGSSGSGKQVLAALDKMCRSKIPETRSSSVQVLEAIIIEKSRMGDFESGPRYCELLLHLLRAGEDISVRSKAAVVFSRLMAYVADSEQVEVRKSGSNYALQALPLFMTLIEHARDDYMNADGVVAGLEGIRGSLTACPGCIRGAPRKLPKTINAMLDHSSELVQKKAAECFAAFTFGRNDPAAWAKMFTLLLSNIYALVERYRGTENEMKAGEFKAVLGKRNQTFVVPVETDEGEISDTVLPRRLHGLCGALVEMLGAPAHSKRSTPVMIPYKMVLSVLDQIILNCMRSDTKKTKALEVHVECMNCLIFRALSPVFCAFFRSLGDQVLKVYTQASTLLVAVLRWAAEKKFPSLRYDTYLALYSFLSAAKSCLNQSVVDTVASLCIGDMKGYDGAVETAQVQKNENTSRAQKRNKVSREHRTWGNLRVFGEKRIRACCNILRTLVVSSGPHMSATVRGMIHDISYDAFALGAPGKLRSLVLRNKDVCKDFYALLLACATVPSASSLPSIYSFSLHAFQCGLDQKNDEEISVFCRSAIMSVTSLMRPRAQPLLAYTRTVAPMQQTKFYDNENNGRESESGESSEEEEDSAGHLVGGDTGSNTMENSNGVSGVGESSTETGPSDEAPKSTNRAVAQSKGGKPNQRSPKKRKVEEILQAEAAASSSRPAVDSSLQKGDSGDDDSEGEDGEFPDLIL